MKEKNCLFFLSIINKIYPKIRTTSSPNATVDIDKNNGSFKT